MASALVTVQAAGRMRITLRYRCNDQVDEYRLRIQEGAERE
jgi:hypothetical protein